MRQERREQMPTWSRRIQWTPNRSVPNRGNCRLLAICRLPCTCCLGARHFSSSLNLLLPCTLSFFVSITTAQHLSSFTAWLISALKWNDIQYTGWVIWFEQLCCLLDNLKHKPSQGSPVWVVAAAHTSVWINYWCQNIVMFLTCLKVMPFWWLFCLHDLWLLNIDV